VKTICGFLLLALTAGCVDVPILREQPKLPEKPAPVKAARAPAPVTAEQVTDTNAHAKAEALQRELEAAADGE
jgi:hypothetical protein